MWRQKGGDLILVQKITPEQIAFEQRRRAEVAARNGPIGWRAIFVLAALFFAVWFTTFLKDYQKARALSVDSVPHQSAVEKSTVASTVNFHRLHPPTSRRKTEP